MSRRRYFVSIPASGGIEHHPLKEWARRHREIFPPYFDPSETGTTTHKIRDELRRLGWSLEESETTVHMSPPSSSGRDESADVPHTRVIYHDAETGEIRSVRVAARPEYGDAGELRVGRCFWKRGAYLQVIDESDDHPLPD